MSTYDDGVNDYKKKEMFFNVIRRLCPEMQQISEDKLMDFIYESKVSVSSNSMSLLDFDTQDLELLMLKYAEQIYYMYIDDTVDESYFQDLFEYIEAISNKDDEKYFVARIVSASVLADILKIYSKDELIKDEKFIKRELSVGLSRRLIAFAEGMSVNSRVKCLLTNKEQYRELLFYWDEKDFDCYCDLELYHEYLQSILESEKISKEKREKINGYLKRLKVITDADLNDVVEHREQLKDFFDDFVTDYEILVRENLLENIFEAGENKVQQQVIECFNDDGSIEKIDFEGIIITSSEQVNSMMLHFLNHSYTNNKLNFERYFIEKRRELALKRGVKNEEDISVDDPELFSTLRHFLEVLSDSIVVDGIAQYDDTKHMEHICTQVLSSEEIKKIHSNSSALLFDKNRCWS